MHHWAYVRMAICDIFLNVRMVSVMSLSLCVYLPALPVFFKDEYQTVNTNADGGDVELEARSGSEMVNPTLKRSSSSVQEGSSSSSALLPSPDTEVGMRSNWAVYPAGRRTGSHDWLSTCCLLSLSLQLSLHLYVYLLFYIVLSDLVPSILSDEGDICHVQYAVCVSLIRPCLLIPLLLPVNGVTACYTSLYLLPAGMLHTFQRKSDPKVSGPVYWRASFSEGGSLIQVFGELQRGLLKLYKTEEVGVCVCVFALSLRSPLLVGLPLFLSLCFSRFNPILYDSVNYFVMDLLLNFSLLCIIFIVPTRSFIHILTSHC